MKALLKKQLMETFAFLYQSDKSGKRRSMVSVIAYVLLFIYAFGAVAFLMGIVAGGLCEPLVMAGMDWLYFALMGILATTMGVVGSVFSTYSGLYQAKDNELLLSMPLRPSHILGVRMLSCYVLSLFFELLVLIPAGVVYAMNATLSFPAVLLQGLTALVLPVLGLSISCVLGWLIAIIAARLQGSVKTIATVVLSVGFIAGYYYVYMQAYQYLQLLLANRDQVGEIVQTFLYPLYQMGLAACGNVGSFLIFTLIIGLLFAVVYIVLSRSFLHLTTTKRGGVRVKYRKQSMRKQSIDVALLKREFSRYTHSTTYMLNCSMGLVFFVVGAVALLWQGDTVRAYVGMLQAAVPMLEPMIPLIASAGVGMIGGMNYLSAPSVSLEGKSIWIVQTLPLDPWKILRAKLSLHLLLTLLPALLFTGVLVYVIDMSPMAIALLTAATVCFIWASGAMGLVLGVVFVNVNWTNEISVVKQGASVMLTLLLNWVIVIALGVLYYFLSNVMRADLYLILCIIGLALLAIGCTLWLKRTGTKRFAELSA